MDPEEEQRLRQAILTRLAQISDRLTRMNETIGRIEGRFAAPTGQDSDEQREREV